MTKKENKGGELTNEQVERDLKTKHQEQKGGYRGSQDTGEQKVRQPGSKVQRTSEKRKSSPGKD